MIALLVFWVLFRQWDRTRSFFLGRPLLGAAIECGLIILMAYSLQGLLLLVRTLPRFASVAPYAQAAASLTLHVGCGLAIARFFEALLGRRNKDDPDWHLTRLARIGLYGIFVLLAGFTFLISTGRAPAELFVVTGAGAAVLAFVMQQTLGDLFSGLSLTVERPFEVGDWILLSDGTEGRVQDINWRATHLRKWDNTTFVIPNGRLAQESFTNLYSRKDRNAFAPWYKVKVSGEHPPDQVIKLLKIAVAGCKVPTSSPAPVVRLVDGSQTPYTYMVWVHFASYPTMFEGREELYCAIDETLRANGIDVGADIKEIRLRRLSSFLSH